MLHNVGYVNRLKPSHPLPSTECMELKKRNFNKKNANDDTTTAMVVNSRYFKLHRDFSNPPNCRANSPAIKLEV